jgi:ABC-type amino acid transport system permease subunit
MSELMDLLSNDFLPKFLSGMAVNFEIAAIALGVGLALGLLLAVGRLSGGVVTAITVTIISLMRAAPTFVVMFFLLNAIPRDATLFGAPFALSAVILRQAEQLPSFDDRLVLFAIGIVMFGIPLQIAFALIGLIQRRVGRVAVKEPAVEV